MRSVCLYKPVLRDYNNIQGAIMDDKNNNRRQKIGIVVLITGLIMLVLAVFFGVRYFLNSYIPKNVATEQYGPGSITTPAPAAISVDTDVYPADTETVVSTVDFESLQAINPDIYAWIEIPGTTISYPVVQHPSDDTYYLHRNSDKAYSAGGAIFSEGSYNPRDFTSPVTILYGHHTSADNMFGPLQVYFSDPLFLANDPSVIIYTPDEVYEYTVFAAVPYDNTHILDQYDFNEPNEFISFFESIINIRDLGAYINSVNAPVNPSERVIILSTCLDGNNQRRFLVMGTLVAGQ